MSNALRVDLEPASACGLALDEKALAALPAWGAAEAAAGRLDLLDLGLDRAPAEAARAWSAAAPAAQDVIVVGIGGSALSARLFDSIRPAAAASPRLHVIDTVDPDVLATLKRDVDPSTALLVVISKSGTTLETGAVFLVLEAWFEEVLGSASAAHIAVVSGEEENPLRSVAETRGYASFPIPAGVGGRYSGLTAVGLLPAALVGVDPRALLEGAAEARQQSLSGTLEENPALALAGMHYAAQSAGRNVSVLWPYGEALRPLAPWWVQLVGESLGKPGPAGPLGVTPVAATGPADQHSLLQLLVEGPDDKLTVFVDAGAPAEGPIVPPAGAALTPAAGHSLGALLAAERQATQFALAQVKRPTVAVQLAAADARSVGAFLLTYEMAVVYWGRLLGVDPFGQPGVTLGKQAALARLTGEPAALAARLEEWARA